MQEEQWHDFLSVEVRLLVEQTVDVGVGSPVLLLRYACYTCRMSALASAMTSNSSLINCRVATENQKFFSAFDSISFSLRISRTFRLRFSNSSS